MNYLLKKSAGYGFELGLSLECGQCFHYEKIDENEYVVVIKDKLLHAKEDDESICFYDIEELGDEFRSFFDLDRDYDEIAASICGIEPRLTASVKSLSGLRIFRQDFFECLISFIISANNRIPRIQKSVYDISREYGSYIGTVKGKDYYSFPDAASLAKLEAADLRKLGVGFRDKYIIDAARKYSEKHINETMFTGMNCDEIKQMLKCIKGVGDKVASCIMLFSLGVYDAFPVDTWIKKVMRELYLPDEEDEKKLEAYGRKLFGEYGGFAQQYLFCYIREKERK